VLLQIEHIDAAPHLGEILAVPDVDGIIFGPYDLSASMGKPGQISHPEVAKVITDLASSCNDRGMAWGAFAPDAPTGKTHLERGATLIVLGTDTMHLGKSAKAALEDVRAPHHHP